MDPPDPGSLPPGYPEDCERQVTLDDGRQVFIRPILPSDAPELANAIKTADADTLRSRFLGGPPPVTPALLAHLTQVDYVRRLALVAIDPGTGAGVAIARYEQLARDEAEVAIVVSPPWRQAGLATALLSLLAQAALARGIHTFTAAYFAGNRPVAALAEDAGGLIRQIIEQGITESSFALEGPGTSPADQSAAAEPATGAEQNDDPGGSPRARGGPGGREGRPANRPEPDG